ncbi:MAG: hypothetical protein MSA31_09745 [Bacteroidales bacterium]|nr:hypothetical protein [Bacteroidales bacterium]
MTPSKTSEWICLQAIRELEIDKFLKDEGWSEIQINTTLAHLITRTIYSPSELKSMRIMEMNSAVCELVSGNQEWTILAPYFGFAEVWLHLSIA